MRLWSCNVTTNFLQKTRDLRPGRQTPPGLFFAMDFSPILIGFVVGTLVGATSTGGGALLTPALILIAQVPPSIAIGSDVLIASGMKLFGGGFYALRQEVHWPTVRSVSYTHLTLPPIYSV